MRSAEERRHALSTPVRVVDPPGGEIIIYVYFGVPYYSRPGALVFVEENEGVQCGPTTLGHGQRGVRTREHRMKH